MANSKGEKVETGIWKHPHGKGYLAEINFTDPQTNRRVREQKTTRLLDLARDWRQTRKADALRGEIRIRKDQPKPMRFEIFTKEYLEQWSKIKKKNSTYVRDQTSVRRLNRTLSKKLLSELTRRDVEKYLAERQSDGVTPATMNRELCCLKNMLRKAVDWDYLKENPARGITQQRENPPEFEVLTKEEIKKLLNTSVAHQAKDGRANDHLLPILVVAIYTGMRRGEIFRLTWDAVDFDQGKNGLITIRDSKNGDTRYIPMNSVVRHTLSNHAITTRHISQGKVCSWVFHNEGQPLTDVKKGYHKALERAGITRHIRFHDLRHTFASHLVMEGIDIRTVAKLIGHRDIKMTMRYAHLAPEHLQAAVDALETSTVWESQKQADGSP